MYLYEKQTYYFRKEILERNIYYNNDVTDAIWY